ncbi:MAG: AAA family ATPase [Nitrospirales bacterium]
MPLISDEKRSQFIQLFDEFASTYPETPDGRQHVAGYSAGRTVAERNYAEISAADARGEEITDAVLLKLLPYADSKNNRESGAWIHLAPTINGDIRKWYEAKGWTRAEDWPRVARAIFSFVKQCVDEPEALVQHCVEFDQLPYTKGFQAGTLSPILNALRPGSFMVINSKSLGAINYFGGRSIKQAISAYPEASSVGHQLVVELQNVLTLASAPDILAQDAFDMFCHWLRAVKHFDFREVRYWKVATGERGEYWEEWQEGGYMSIGWPALGDLRGMTQTEYEERRTQCIERNGYKRAGCDEVWKFVRQIQEGDRIVANRGKSLVLGIGTVTGEHFIVEAPDQVHRVSVEWDDVIPMAVKQQHRWIRTLIELGEDEFKAIIQTPSETDGEVVMGQSDSDSEAGGTDNVTLGAPLNQIFPNRETANRVFDFFRDALIQVGCTGQEDVRFAATIPVNKPDRLLRVNFGSLYFLNYYGANKKLGECIGIPLDLSLISLNEPHNDRGVFTQLNKLQPKSDIHMIDLRLESLPLPDLSEDIEPAFQSASSVYQMRFSRWGKSPYRRAHQQAVMDAFFDLDARRRLFDGSEPLPAGSYFSEETFQLLDALHLTPTKAFYNEHKEAFQQTLEQPFRELLTQVAHRLPGPITDVMETQKNLIGNVRKNDYGNGGAWDFYWGAFYPKGGKRTEDAQLSVWIDRRFMEFGFYIGDKDSEQKQRFRDNCERYFDDLSTLLAVTFSQDNFLFGTQDTFAVSDDGTITQQQALLDEGWKEFLRNPAAFGYDVSIVIPKQRLLQIEREALTNQVAEAHQLLFPLVLLATEDDPMPAIEAYLKVPPPGVVPNPKRALEDIAEESGFELDLLQRWVRAIERKGQAILYGPPGTGKTFIAEELANHLIGGGDGFAELVQFHPAYAYEDFMQGIRPQTVEGQLKYDLVEGRFLEFCRRAEKRSGISVLIVDEINRANLARVFGELMYLLEYRDRKIPLAGGGELGIPKNVRILGTMNTADRSIALVDHALRRRFAFLALQPNVDILRHFHQREETGYGLGGLIGVLQEINHAIRDPHYEVGITFFLRRDLAEQISDIWQMEIEPYLEEFFFDQPDTVAKFRWNQVRLRIMP